MIIFIENHKLGYELSRVVRIFCFGEQVAVQEGAPPPDFAEEFLYAGLHADQMIVRSRMRLRAGADASWADPEAFDLTKPLVSMVHGALAPDAPPRAAEHWFAVQFYELLARYTGLRPAWGVLTGIRPVKLLLQQMQAGADETALRRYFIEERLLSAKRFELAYETALVQRPLLERVEARDFSLYVSIPFCPTRCDYCSFVSHSVEKAAHLIPAYLDQLCEELRETAAMACSLGLRLRTVYFGGGTPTTFSAGQLERLMGVVAEAFDLSGLWEYTVEAGRPDTITEDKLRVLRAGGCDRISINPQTLSDEVLRVIGRRHTSAQLRESYALARAVGFKAINMDLIAGLPTDSAEGFRATFDEVRAMEPENVTVHTLTVKRAAGMTFERAANALRLAKEMTDYARAQATAAGYRPYYLYRQSGSLSALENVGYAKPGCEGLYNLYIMEECQTILAVGAGASTKLCTPDGKKIERVYNFKYPYEYLERYEQNRARKEQIRAFFGQVL